ncbi:hypothetical protein DICPUDRAFT_160041 [Dictyostelium purpureum]|uniref:Uncharacterized protein n=1 Tax=Dictyostelium purpureum TaxID=5786 RepID=F1A5K4_DICPU|nr:uncharacterized protein DICPUDRAFT_160041 [Dictyostelium purpureum]EGC28527.1 hypothetical protein DICPUDRAFT_160041 [Dictyostelium purpureum]|eukprot:XP_003294948.1 hypothetical protein DICPUDRAFT_160041 [Dictyostelium purpureum]
MKEENKIKNQFKKIRNQQNKLIKYHKLNSIKEHIQIMEKILLFLKNRNIIYKTVIKTIRTSIESIKACIQILKENKIGNQKEELIQYHKIKSIKEHIKIIKSKLLFLKNGNTDETSNLAISESIESIKSTKKCIKILEELLIFHNL